MLDRVIDVCISVFEWDRRLSVLGTLFLILLTTRFLTTWLSEKALKQTGRERKPPIVPYTIPFMGNMLDFLFDSKQFLGSMRTTYGPSVPVQFRIFNIKIHYISGVENLLALFRGSRDLTTSLMTILILENHFGSPASVGHIFRKDKTGTLAQPLKGVQYIEPHNRIFLIQYKNIHKHLVGSEGLSVLAAQFDYHMRKEMGAMKIDQIEWTRIPDFYRLVQATGFTALTTALCGPHIFELNPDFASDFWEFDSWLPILFKQLPKWMIPRSFRIRDKLISSISKWHEFAEANFDREQEVIAQQDWEPFLGHRLMRDRNIDHNAIEGYHEGVAANDLVPAIAWMILDIVLRPDLLATIQAEIADSKENGELDASKLLSQPLFQSVYSEELRLRAAVVVQRVPIIDNFKLGPWRFPKGQMIMASSWHKHRNTSVWNEGPAHEYPLDEFWAERFLVYPNDPSSGPRKPDSKSTAKRAVDIVVGGTKPVFTTDSVQGSFIPYGGGLNLCPGRFFAKHEIIVATAIFLDTFEFEFESKEFPKPNMAYFPFGLLPSKGEFPVRMRRRQK